VSGSSWRIQCFNKLKLPVIPSVLPYLTKLLIFIDIFIFSYKLKNWKNYWKAKPVVRQGRKATGFMETAGLPEMYRVAGHSKSGPAFFIP
jgi:hypothetical protein